MAALTGLMFSLLAATLVQQDEGCSAFDGARVISEDGQFLGVIENRYSSNSIFNRYGTYGSRYSTNSVWNDYGQYGGRYASGSARNPYASDPPYLVKDRTVIGRLSTNRHIQAAVNPIVLGTVCYDYEPEE